MSYRPSTGYASDDGYSPAPGYGGGAFSSSSGMGMLPCCPLVVDPLTLTAILGLIAGFSAFLANLISVSLGRRKRKRRGLNINSMISDILYHGRSRQSIFGIKNLIAYMLQCFIDCSY